MNTQQLVQGVREYAKEHYEEDGWDYLVECYSDEEIIPCMEGATDLQTAIKNVHQYMLVHDSRRKDVEGEIF